MSNGAQYSGPKIGIPAGAMGPAFRVPLTGRANLPNRVPGGGVSYETPPGDAADPFADLIPRAYTDTELEARSDVVITDPWAPPREREPVVVYNADEFLSSLPPQGLTLFHRMFTFVGSTVLAAVGTFTQNLFTLSAGQSLILTRVEQLWFQDANSAAEPDALAPFPQYWNANGKVSFNLLLNNSAVFNAQETLIDPDGGANTSRNAPGFTGLGVNLLDFGLHPTAAYLLEGEVEAQWNIQDTPASAPSTIGVKVRGFLAPTKTVYETIIDVRRRARLGP